MNKGLVSILAIVIILGVMSVGVAGTIFIAKTGDDRNNRIFVEEDKGAVIPEVSEVPLPITSSHTAPNLQEQKEVQTPDVVTPVDTALLNLEREIGVLFEAGVPIGEEHYFLMVKRIDDAERGGSDTDVLARLRDVLEAIRSYAPQATYTEPQATTTAEEKTEMVSCANDIRPKLTADITDFSKVRKITAPGTASIEGPKGHSFIWTSGARVPVYAPAEITFESGSYSKDTESSPAQYLLFFTTEENCNYRVKFDHIDEPVVSIKEQMPSAPAVGDSRTTEAQNKIKFNAGDLIGHTSGTKEAGNWDFGMYNLNEEGPLKRVDNAVGIHGYAVCWADFYFPDIKKYQYKNLLEGPMLVCFF